MCVCMRSIWLGFQPMKKQKKKMILVKTHNAATVSKLSN